MDAELAKSVVDDAFEGLGTPDCLYQPPGGGSAVEDLRVILHRSSAAHGGRGAVKFSRGDMDFRTDVQPAAVVYRAADLPDGAAEGGVFTIAGVEWTVGEGEPLDDDLHGWSRRVPVVRA